MNELSAFMRWLRGDVVSATPPRQLVIVAGSASGCGASTIAALLARAVAAAGSEALLIDACTGHASLTATLSPHAPMLDAGDTPQLTQLCDGMTLVRSGSAARTKRIQALIPRFDVAIVDAGSRIAPLRELLGALSDGVCGFDQLLVVSRATPRDSAGAYALIKNVGARALAPQMHLLINRADADVAAHAYERVEAATRRFCHRSVAYAGAFPSDPQLHAGEHDVVTHVPPGDLLADAASSDLVRRILRPFSIRTHAPISRRPLSAQIR